MLTRNEFFQFYENIDSATIIRVLKSLRIEEGCSFDLVDDHATEPDVPASEIYEIENIETLKDYGWRGQSFTTAVGSLELGKEYILYQEYSRAAQGYGNFFTTERVTLLTSEMGRNELQWIEEYEKQDWRKRLGLET